MVVRVCLEYVFLCCTMVFKADAKSSTDSIGHPISAADLHGSHSIYTLFTIGRPWNEAREVCQSIGGDLAKIPSSAVIFDMEKQKDEIKDFFKYSYISGAIQVAADEVLWISDCTSETVPGTSDMKYIKPKDYVYQEPVCLKAYKEQFYVLEDCNTSATPFMCETKSLCELTSALDMDAVQFDGVNESVCTELCYKDVTCWAAIATPNLCLNAIIPGYSSTTLTMMTKQCSNTASTYEVRINDSALPLPPHLVTDALQKSGPPNCREEPASTSLSTTITSSPLTKNTPTPTTMIPPTNQTSPQPPQVITSTQIVTSTQFTTRYVTSTENGISPTSRPQINVSETVPSEIVDPSSTDFATYNASLALIDWKNTSKYRRTKTSAPDKRNTSIFIGVCSVLLVIIPIWAIVISDIRTIIKHFLNHKSMYSKKSAKPGNKLRSH